MKLIDQLQAAGLNLALNADGNITLRYRQPLTDAQKVWLKARKGYLLRELGKRRNDAGISLSSVFHREYHYVMQ